MKGGTFGTLTSTLPAFPALSFFLSFLLFFASSASVSSFCFRATNSEILASTSSKDISFCSCVAIPCKTFPHSTDGIARDIIRLFDNERATEGNGRPWRQTTLRSGKRKDDEIVAGTLVR